MSSSKGVGIPVKLLHEAEGHVITVCFLFTLLMLGGLPSSTWIDKGSRRPLQAELKSGEMYRGELVEAEDSWNVQLKNFTATSKVRTRRSLL